MVRSDQLELYALLDRIIDRLNKLETKIDEESTYQTTKIKELNKKLDSSYTPFILQTNEDQEERENFQIK